MKPLSSESEFLKSIPIRLFISIYFITKYWIANRRKVYTNLMGSPREEIDLEEAIFIMIKTKISKFRFCNFWVEWIYCCHLFSIVRVPSDKRLYIPIFIMYLSDDEGEVCFFYRSFCDFELERMHSFIIFRDDDNSTRIFIEAMDDSWSLDSVDDGLILFFLSFLRMQESRVPE